jgi:multiple antibiotic resistance protein
MHVAPSILSSFVTLFVTIGPVETAVVFASLTAGIHRQQRRSLARRSVAIAGFVLMLFAVAGSTVLALLHISLSAFRVAGGLLLFLQALTLTSRAPVFPRSTRRRDRMPKGPATSRCFRSPFRSSQAPAVCPRRCW